jgi:hypothetical protein
MKPVIALLLLLSGASWIAAAQAQTMYRCGKTYQDRPCAAGQAGKAMGSAVSSSAPAAGAAGDAECVQKGKDSLKIVWSREGGATEERLLGEAHSEAQRRFIRDVYRRPGAASTVQAAVEADCVAAKAQAEQDTAIAIAAALKAQREGKLASPPAGYGNPAAASGAAADPALEERRKAEQLAAAAKRRCDGLGSELDRLRADERRGGSAQTMERLAERRRELHAQMSKAGC